MKKILLIPFALILMSCSNLSQSIFFEDCSCKKIDIASSISVTDTLGHFSFSIPDSSWLPYRELSASSNLLIVGDTLNGTVRTFNVLEENYQGVWDWESEQITVEQNYEVLNTGDVTLDGVYGRWNLVFYRDSIPQSYVLYISLVNQEKLYTLSTQVEPSNDYLIQICELETIIQSFKIQ